jgi:hypothetical protein
MRPGIMDDPMGRTPLRHVSVTLSLLAALLVPVAPAGASDPVSPPCDSLPGPAPDRVPVLLDPVGLNFTSDQLALDPAALELCVLVDRFGVARELRVARGGTPFDSAAVDAVRWWLFEPARRGSATVPAWLRVVVDAHPPADTGPIVPDVLALAADAGSRGDTPAELDAWTGALARVGAHTSLGNEWAIREHILRLAATSPRPVPGAIGGPARGARNLMQRNIARANNADYAHTLDGVLRAAPWYVDAYRWRAAARAASGQRTGAMRDVLCYRLGAPDSASRALADRALEMLAVGDTLSANSLLKN